MVLTGVLLALLGFLGLLGLLGATAPAAAASARPRQVVLAAVPGVTWEDVAAGRAPVLRSLGERWSMAALSIRTAVSPTDADSAMTTIGAGNHARGRTAADNAGLHFGAVPGALGEALHEHGLRTAASGDSTNRTRRNSVSAPAPADPVPIAIPIDSGAAATS